MSTVTTHDTASVPASIDWVRLALNQIDTDHATVLVMIAEDAGSTPRDEGAWILVGHKATLGTLGGGQLEKIAEEAAKELLRAPSGKRRFTLRSVLGPDARQCCGGAVKLAFELLDAAAVTWLKKAEESIQNNADDAVLFPIGDTGITPQVISASQSVSTTASVHLQSLRDTRPWLFLFGAGHVGRSICAIASQLPLRMVVLDSREPMQRLLRRTNNMTIVNMAEPEADVSSIPRNSAALVMTHSHELDYRLCRALLKRDDLAFVGLIGSNSKAARFRHRLRKDGVRPRAIDFLTSPIGKAGPTGKEPGVIALAALMEIMTIFDVSTTKKRVERDSQSSSLSNQHG